MIRNECLFAICLLCAMLSFRTFATEQTHKCLPAEVTIDSANRSARLSVRTHKPPLLDLGIWHPSTDTSVTQNKEKYEFFADISHNNIPNGREYPRIIRISPDIVAINFSNLITKHDGNDTICESLLVNRRKLKNTTLLETTGFLILINGRQSLGKSLFASNELGLSTVDTYAKVRKSSTEYFRSLFGEPKRRVVSVLFINDQALDDKTCRFNGSSLPGLLLIGIGRQCLKEDKPPEGFEHYIAHETFHQWNYTLANQSDSPDTLLLVEGGAEFASTLYLSRAKDNLKSDQSAIRESVPAIKQCMQTEKENHASVEKMILGGNSTISYPCGALFNLLLSLRPSNYITDEFAKYWLKLLTATAVAHSKNVAVDLNVSDNFSQVSQLFREDADFYDGVSKFLDSRGYTLDSNYVISRARSTKPAESVTTQ